MASLLSSFFKSDRQSTPGPKSRQSLHTRRPPSTTASQLSPAAENPANQPIQEPQKPISAIPPVFDDFEACLTYIREYKLDPADSSHEEQWSFAWNSNLEGHYNPVSMGGRPYDGVHRITAWEDTNLCAAWIDELEKLLIFAGLFSGVVTAFVIQSYQILQEDPNEVSARMLTQIATQLGNPSAQALTPLQISPPFSPPRWAVIVNIVWVISVSLSLIAALAGILCMQWIREFRRETNLSAKDKLSLRQLRYDGLQRWHVPTIMTALPVMLQLALLLFFAGLLQFMWNLHVGLAISLLVVLGPVIVFYFASTFAPAAQFWYGKQWFMGPQCPYKSPQAWVALKCTVYFAAFVVACVRVCRRGASLLREKRFGVGIPVDPEQGLHAVDPQGKVDTAATAVTPVFGVPAAAVVQQPDRSQSIPAITVYPPSSGSPSTASYTTAASSVGDVSDRPSLSEDSNQAQEATSKVLANPSSLVDTPDRKASDLSAFHSSHFSLHAASPTSGTPVISNSAVHMAIPSTTASVTTSPAKSVVAQGNNLSSADPTKSQPNADASLPTNVQVPQTGVSQNNSPTTLAVQNVTNSQGRSSTLKPRRYLEGQTIQSWNEYDTQWRRYRHDHNSANEFRDLAKTLNWIISAQSPHAYDIRFVIFALYTASLSDPDAAIPVLEHLRNRHVPEKEVIVPCLIGLLKHLSREVDPTDPTLANVNLPTLKSDMILACSMMYFPQDNETKEVFINSFLELCIRVLNAPVALGLWDVHDVHDPDTEACNLFSYFDHTFRPHTERFDLIHSNVLEQLIHLVTSRPILDHTTKKLNLAFELFFWAVRQVAIKKLKDEDAMELSKAIMSASQHLEGWMTEKMQGLTKGDSEGFETLLECVAWVLGAFAYISPLAKESDGVVSEWTNDEAPEHKLIKTSLFIFMTGTVLQKSTTLGYKVGHYLPDAWGRPQHQTSDTETGMKSLRTLIYHFGLREWAKEFVFAVEYLKLDLRNNHM